jgi:large subunit ribosomal protein L15
MPIMRRLPKRGFHNRNRKASRVVNVAALALLGEGATVNPETLVNRGLIPRRGGPVKLLGQGDAPRKLTVAVHKISASARQKIEEAGGSVEIVK